MIKFNVFERLKMKCISYEKTFKKKKKLYGWEGRGAGIGVGCGEIGLGYEHFCLFNIYGLRLRLRLFFSLNAE